jgi:hypothetical protein
MKQNNFNAQCVKVTWARQESGIILMGECTMGVQTEITDPVPSLGVLNLNRNVSPEVIADQITSFSPEPYALKSPMHIKILGREGEYIASHHESNIHASGDTTFEAIENLKSIILDTFDLLTSEPLENLGSKAKSQRAILEGVIEHR